MCSSTNGGQLMGQPWLYLSSLYLLYCFLFDPSCDSGGPVVPLQDATPGTPARMLWCAALHCFLQICKIAPEAFCQQVGVAGGRLDRFPGDRGCQSATQIHHYKRHLSPAKSQGGTEASLCASWHSALPVLPSCYCGWRL